MVAAVGGQAFCLSTGSFEVGEPGEKTILYTDMLIVWWFLVRLFNLIKVTNLHLNFFRRIQSCDPFSAPSSIDESDDAEQNDDEKRPKSESR